MYMNCKFWLLADADIGQEQTVSQQEEVRFVPDNEPMTVHPLYNRERVQDDREADVEIATPSIDQQIDGDDSLSQDSQISVEIEKEFRDYFRQQSNQHDNAEACDSKTTESRNATVDSTMTDSASKARNETDEDQGEMVEKPPIDLVAEDVDTSAKVDIEQLKAKEKASKKLADADGQKSATLGDPAGTAGSTTLQIHSTRPETASKQGVTGLLATEANSSSAFGVKEGSEKVEMQHTSTSKSQPSAPEKKPDEVKSYFKLGMEGSYVMYENQYYSNSLASSKHDHQAERDKRRALGNKFRLYDFKWLGEIYQGPALVVNTLRSTLLSFESSIPTAFLHPMWYKQLPSWIKGVRMCKDVPEFAAMLSVLQRAIKPIIVLNVWREALGNVSLKRVQAEGKIKKGPRSIRDKDSLEEDLDDDENGIIKPKGILDSIQYCMINYVSS